MPLPKTRSARKAALALPKPSEMRTSPAPVNPYRAAEALAMKEAGGLVRYEVVAPRTLAAAQAARPEGPMSVEYGPGHAVREERKALDPDAIRLDLRRAAAERAEQAEADRRAKDFLIRRRAERAARRDMGDYRDDEAFDSEDI